MNDICLISSDKKFARMLEIELFGIGLKVKTVTETLNPPALKLIVDTASLVIFDAEYYSGDLSFVGKNQLPFVVFGKKAVNVDFENVIAFFERPFRVTELTKLVGDKFDVKRTVGMTVNHANTAIYMELDPFTKKATIDGKSIKFSPKEFALLSLLYKNRGHIVPRQKVINTVWGKDYDTKNNADNVYINYLRKKLDDTLGVKIIYTIRGNGDMMK